MADAAELGLSEAELTGNPSLDGMPEQSTPKSKENSTLRTERDIAQSFIDSRATQVNADLKSGKVKRTDLNNGDKAIWDAFMFRGELPEGQGTSIDKGEGVSIQMDNQVFTVISISNGRTKDDGRVYSGKIKDPDNPENDPIDREISGDAIADGYVAKHAADIANSFPEGPQRDLVAWHASGGKGDPPDSTAELIAHENNPIARRDKIIQDSITSLRFEINNAVAAGSEISPEQRQRLTQLELAQGLQESDISNLAALGALKNLAARGVTEASDILVDIEHAAKAEADKIKPELAKAGITEEEFNLIQTEGLSPLLENRELLAKFENIDNLSGILGPNMSPEKLTGIIEANLPPEQKTLWDKLKKDGKASGGILLAILIGMAAIPAAALYASAAMAPAMGGKR